MSGPGISGPYSKCPKCNAGNIIPVSDYIPDSYGRTVLTWKCTNCGYGVGPGPNYPATY